MSHPFGDLLLQFRARKRGLSQTRLAHLAGYGPAIVIHTCVGKKDLTGPSGRDQEGSSEHHVDLSSANHPIQPSGRMAAYNRAS